MRKLLVGFAFALLSAGVAFAHDPSSHASKEGLLGLKPEYLHVLLNPLLAYGLGIGVGILGLGLLTRNKTMRTVGLAVTTVCAASAWPVLYFGQHGYNSLSPLLDSESHEWLDAHMARAERFIYVFYATAVLGIIALAFSRKAKSSFLLSLLTLALGGFSLGIGAWIARAGGQISHSEFRDEGTPSPPPEEIPHDHGGEKTPMKNSRGHNHPMPPEPDAVGRPTPETV
ncbi:MAG: hypothetical protein ABIV39_01115, partial [Verrucomicrobiota bacterium]